MQFNKTLLYPIGNTPMGDISGNNRRIFVQADIPAENNTLLTEMEFLVMIGDTNITPLSITDERSIGDRITVNPESGTFTLLSDKLYLEGRRTALHQNEPNPAAGQTTIRYETAESGQTELLLYDLFGRRLEYLDRGFRSRGEYEIQFNSGKYPIGTYYIILRTPTDWRLKKMIIMR
jgi:hypothetical protein